MRCKRALVVNEEDSAGDEGTLFAALVQGKSLTEAEVVQLRQEDDSATIVVDGQAVNIEQATASSPSNPFYQYEIVSQSVNLGFNIRPEVSINDKGRIVWFVAAIGGFD